MKNSYQGLGISYQGLQVSGKRESHRNLFVFFMASSYRNLIVWQKAFSLVEKIYLYTHDFPREELYGLVDQMRRAAVSIPSNIAEGSGR